MSFHGKPIRFSFIFQTQMKVFFTKPERFLPLYLKSLNFPKMFK